MMSFTRSAAAMAAAVVTGLSLLAIASPASAAAYDGTDPNSAGCASGAITARKAFDSIDAVDLIEVDLRYSPRCKTAWARITLLGLGPCPSGAPCGYVTVHRNSDGRQYSCSIPAGAHGCYSPQVNDNGVTSYATGFANTGGLSASATTSSY
jgi:hypothetical protein